MSDFDDSRDRWCENCEDDDGAFVDSDCWLSTIARHVRTVFQKKKINIWKATFGLEAGIGKIGRLSLCLADFEFGFLSL